MTVLINGTVDFRAAEASTILEQAAELIADTRKQKGCRHYVWSLDPVVPGRMYVYENWESVEDLAAHLAGHCYSDMLNTLGQFDMLGTDILKYRIDHAEPVYDATGAPRADFFSG